MHQTVRVCHTDHSDSIVSCMACIFDFKNYFLCNRKLINNSNLSGLDIALVLQKLKLLKFLFYAPDCKSLSH